MMGVAYECSKAGMAAKAIGRLIEAVLDKFPNGLGNIGTVYLSRGPELSYQIESRENRVPGYATVTLKIDVHAPSNWDRAAGREAAMMI